MRAFTSILKREIKSYFSTPVAYVFWVIFLFFSGFLTFRAGFFEARQATLNAFFAYMPMLFLFLVPAIAMRLWAEERRSNSIELLLTLPVTPAQAVLGKFFAAWAVLILALALTFPMVITVAMLGDPDFGPIATGYLGCILMAGAYLAIGSFFSAITRNQVIAFILGVVGCGVFLFAGSPRVMDFAAGLVSVRLAEAIESLSVQSHFEALQRGVVQLRNLLFFVILMAGWLWANVVVVTERRGS